MFCLESIWFVFILIDFFFFKQKTAYEMRISDWSSDVCSSDLLLLGHGHRGDEQAEADHGGKEENGASVKEQERAPQRHPEDEDRGQYVDRDVEQPYEHRRGELPHQRSEEHTSELQSLMRISYAVFCLKTKKITNKTHTTQ